MKLINQVYFGTFCDMKILFARTVNPTWLLNVPQSLPDPQPLRIIKSINPILRNCNLKEARLKHFPCFYGKILKIWQKCFNLASFKSQFLKIGLMDFRFLKRWWSGRLLGAFLVGFTVHPIKIFMLQKVPKCPCLSSFIFEGL